MGGRLACRGATGDPDERDVRRPCSSPRPTSSESAGGSRRVVSSMQPHGRRKPPCMRVAKQTNPSTQAPYSRRPNQGGSDLQHGRALVLVLGSQLIEVELDGHVGRVGDLKKDGELCVDKLLQVEAGPGRGKE